MSSTTLQQVLAACANAETFDDLKLSTVSLALAVIQLNAEVDQKAATGTKAALLKYTAKERTSRGR